ncbi:IS110 family transposase [Mucilaginibacter ximonensis]|uniref:IS110 family transposase n=1 Tax=Mucilaginibacter ximonensis TaxID=538021 RepID=A0ABW5Y999_9SPHI
MIVKEKTRIKKYTFFIGTDVSRNKLDHAVMEGRNLLFHTQTENNGEAIAAFVTELKALKGFTVTKSVFCLEQTGIYGRPILSALQRQKANIVLEGASHIRSSMGNIRTKNDKVDSIRIAEYAYKHREELRLYIPKRPLIQELKELSALRERLITTQYMLKVPIKEAKIFTKKSVVQQSEKLCMQSLLAIKSDLETLETEISNLWKADERLNRLMAIITSVPGVGPVTALQIIICSNEFKDIRDPKKFACYSGVAPFIKESGTIKGKAKVSHMANKKVKALLHTCAMNSRRSDAGIKAYFDRKTVQEGKNKMSVLNAIRYKLILRIFACVNQDRLYEKNYIRPQQQQQKSNVELTAAVM